MSGDLRLVDMFEVALLPGSIPGKPWRLLVVPRHVVFSFRGGKDYSAQVELFKQCVTVGERRIIDHGKRR